MTPGTIEDSLKRSPLFREMAKTNKNKELLIQRKGKAISPHLPCFLINDELLKVSYIKQQTNLSNTNSATSHPKRDGQTGKCVLFDVVIKGGDNTKIIMKNRELSKKVVAATVYAYEGETVRYALENDGRFLNTVFEKNCVLVDEVTERKTEMLGLVNKLNGKTVRITKLDNKRPPKRRSESQDDVKESKSQRSDSNENQDPPQQSTTAERVNDGATKEKPEQNDAFQPGVIPKTEKVRNYLLSQVKNLVIGKKTTVSALSNVQKLFHAEYGKNAQTCREVKTMKELMALSASVCQVRIDGNAVGTGFLLFNKFVLTNGHVVSNIYDAGTRQLSATVTVNFCFESLDQSGSGIMVENVAGLEYRQDTSGQKYDWALLTLKVSAPQIVPNPLLKHFDFLPNSVAICIIGHPEGGVKKVDPCLIIPTNEHIKTVEKHSQENQEGFHVECDGMIQLVTPKFFDFVPQQLQSQGQVLTYESCFYCGSSGSPVFDERCKVVAIHTGGYLYQNKRGEKGSVIEYGYPLSSILEHMLIQMLELQRVDVLEAYLAPDYSQKTKIHANVKKLLESEYKVTLHNAYIHRNNESLKSFCEYLLAREEPVPMDQM